MLKRLKTKLKKLDDKRALLCDEIDQVKAGLNFPCGCGKEHIIRDCEAYQTHWYTPPRGCTEGDYWNEGELQIVCPDTGHRNRILFGAGDREIGAERKFRYDYKAKFKSVKDVYREDLPGGHWNNYSVRDSKEYYDLT